MSDTGQELTSYANSPELLDPATDSWVATIAEVARLASYVCDTPFVPAGLRGNAPSTAATILYGREIGIPPITALQTMHVINGRVGMAAELMRARVLAAGHELDTLESTAAVCRMRGRRRGSETWTEVQWSMGDARQAGLGGDAWKKYPRAMLVARCSAELCRLVFPDVTHGMAALEELDSNAPSNGAAQPATTPRLVGRQPRKQPQQEGALRADTTPAAAQEAASQEQTVQVAPVAQPEQPPQEGTRSAMVSQPPGVAQPLLPGEEEEQPREDDPHAQGKLTGDGPATQPQVRHIMVLLRRLNMGAQRDERLTIAEAICQKRLESFSQLTITDAGRLITTMLLALESDQPRDYMRWLVDEGQRTLAEREAADIEAMAEADTGVGDE